MKFHAFPFKLLIPESWYSGTYDAIYHYQKVKSNGQFSSVAWQGLPGCGSLAQAEGYNEDKN